MSIKLPNEWEEQDVQEMIDRGIEENLHLDYKGMRSLERTESKKKEISKDVSAFANSDGGVIIYGVKEHDGQGKRHLPEKIEDGFDPAVLPREWLEQVIDSLIRPRINGLFIKPILIRRTNKFIYVVNIPKSNTAHQAGDRRYYKRLNFESVPMEDYEIRDVMNRGNQPELEPIFDSRTIRDSSGVTFELQIKLLNKSAVVVNNFQIDLALPAPLISDAQGNCRKTVEEKIAQVSPAHTIVVPFIWYSYIKLEGQVIYPQQEFILLPSAPRRFIICKIDPNITGVILFDYFYWRLYADTMPVKEGREKLNKIIRV